MLAKGACRLSVEREGEGEERRERGGEEERSDADQVLMTVHSSSVQQEEDGGSGLPTFYIERPSKHSLIQMGETDSAISVVTL